MESAQKAYVAVKWLQQAFQIVENAASSVYHSHEGIGDSILGSNPAHLQIKVVSYQMHISVSLNLRQISQRTILRSLGR